MTFFLSISSLYFLEIRSPHLGKTQQNAVNLRKYTKKALNYHTHICFSAKKTSQIPIQKHCARLCGERKRLKKRKPLQKTLFTILSNPLNLRSIQLNPLPSVAYRREVAHEHLLRDHNCGGVVVGVKRERRHIPKVGIQEQMHMILLIVDQSKR